MFSLLSRFPTCRCGPERGNVACFHSCPGSLHADVGPLAPDAEVEELDELLEVAALLVGQNELLQVVGVHNDVHPRDLRAAELA